ncbi:MAG: 5-oxoprolinase subunit PxpB [Candidatus Eremiobacteraeota bacterium]|nr:5-oxoprolinase subunit PxpB [Candidatus Eremiobacteraeota bacterium]
MDTSGIRFFHSGESGTNVVLGSAIDPAINRRVHRLAQSLLRRDDLPSLQLVPAYSSLLVHFNPLEISRRSLEAEILSSMGALGDEGPWEEPSRTIKVPVLYGGERGPDLGQVAEICGLSTEEVIALHSSVPYRVYMLGFTPGFPYLGTVPEKIAVPRLENPRTEIAAGTIGIAGQQTGIYPVKSPGGWRLIGHTPLAIYDPIRISPFLFSPGDEVRFMAVTREEYLELTSGAREGSSIDSFIEIAQDRGGKP